MTESWKLILPCTRAEAEALTGDIAELAMLEPPPAIISHEPDESQPDDWEIHAYFEGEPDAATIAIIQALVPSARGTQAQVERVPDEDWLTLSQSALEPVQAGRFFVHTQSYADAVPPGAIPLRIDAGQAFGTGGHDTTEGCLALLDALQRSGQRFRAIADIGTGTGILAFAAAHLWPRARIIATDIDPASIAYAADYAPLNRVRTGRGAGQVALAVASGVDHPLIRRRAPYDLLVANILAGPLIELAPGIAPLVEAGGTVILAGLLGRQQDVVIAAYAAQGFRFVAASGSADWPTLCFRKRGRYGHRRPSRASGRTSQPPGDFGSW